MIDVKTMFGTYRNCYVKLERYVCDNSLSVMLWNMEDGPIAKLTVCLDDKGLAENESYVDTNNCPWAPDLIEKYGLGMATGRMKASGFCCYPAVRFDVEKLRMHRGEYTDG